AAVKAAARADRDKGFHHHHHHHHQHHNQHHHQASSHSYSQSQMAVSQQPPPPLPPLPALPTLQPPPPSPPQHTSTYTHQHSPPHGNSSAIRDRVQLHCSTASITTSAGGQISPLAGPFTTSASGFDSSPLGETDSLTRPNRGVRSLGPDSSPGIVDEVRHLQLRLAMGLTEEQFHSLIQGKKGFNEL
ncbi:unnamed protein product, partial [Protopolystoma xenopodis]